MNDIEKAIDNLNFIKHNDFNDNIKQYKRIGVNSIDLAISALEEKLNGGWIPVSERLPEERGFYIFQLNDGRVHEYYYANETLYGDCDGQFDEPIAEVAFNLNDVIAWQPLPPVYVEVENE